MVNFGRESDEGGARRGGTDWQGIGRAVWVSLVEKWSVGKEIWLKFGIWIGEFGRESKGEGRAL